MTTPKKGRASGDDDDKDTPQFRRAQREAEDGKREAPDTDEARREAYLDVSREAETIDEASARQEALQQRFPQSLQYPAWIYCDDGRSQIVNAEDEADEVKASGGNWQEEPYPEHPAIAPLPPPWPASPPIPTQLPAGGRGPGTPAYPGQLPGGYPVPPSGAPRPDQSLPEGRRDRPDNDLPEGAEPRGSSSKKK